VGALAAYRASLGIRERLAAQDPSNAEWQRDLWVSYWRMASIAEQNGQADAMAWWRKAYETLSAMKRRGLFVSPQDAQFFAQLRAKVDGAPFGAGADLPQGAAGTPLPHPGADPNRAAQLNAEYQHRLAEWQALPFWKRWRTNKPAPPEGT